MFLQNVYIVPNYLLETLEYHYGEFLTVAQQYALSLYRDLVENYNGVDEDNRIKNLILNDTDVKGIIKYLQNATLECIKLKRMRK